MGTLDSQPNSSQIEDNRGMLWGKLKTLMIVTSLLGLGSLNILTLVDDGVHAVGYNAIKVILASAITDEALSKMLGKSPTA